MYFFFLILFFSSILFRVNDIHIHIGCFHTYNVLIILQHLSYIVCVFVCVYFFSPLSLLCLTAVYFYSKILIFSLILYYFILFYFQKTQQHDTTCKCLFFFRSINHISVLFSRFFIVCSPAPSTQDDNDEIIYTYIIYLYDMCIHKNFILFFWRVNDPILIFLLRLHILKASSHIKNELNKHFCFARLLGCACSINLIK